MKVRYATAALVDLARIRRYIAADAPMAAMRVVLDLVAACEGLERHPHSGRPGVVPGSRELVSVHPFIIVYTAGREGVRIVRVRHGAENR